MACHHDSILHSQGDCGAGSPLPEDGRSQLPDDPDPLGSYLSRLPLQEVSFSTDSESLARPGIDLSAPFEPEPEKEVESERIVRMVEPAPAPPAESSEKTEVLSRIANLRKEISEDDRYVKDTLKLRHEAKEKAAAVEEARRKRGSDTHQ